MGRSMHPSALRKGAIVAVALALLTSACGSLADLTELPSLQEADLRFEPGQTSRVYAANGSVLASLHGEENRIVIPFRRIPQRVWRAVLAIEDERFFEHDGIDLRGITRAAVENLRSGDVRQGGSTITQQYVKNMIIAPNGKAEQSLERKIHEAALARQLERQLSKRQILGRYMNTVYFGNGAYGIAAAARAYFRKGVGGLTVNQASLLAGLIRSPNTYNPYGRRQAARERRDMVLEKMGELGWLEPDRVERIKSRGLKLEPKKEPRFRAPYFVDYVQRLLTHHPRFRMLGATRRERSRVLFEGGLRIETTLDPRAQRHAEDAISSVLTEEQDPHGALVAIDPRNGHVRAMVGGRDYYAGRRKDRFAKLNLAIVAEPRLGRLGRGRRAQHVAPGSGRQAGSAFKPFALAEALSRGIPLSKTYPGGRSCEEFPGANAGQPWRVCNYGNASFGTLSLMQATAQSVNIVFARLILELGPERVVRLAEDMGINTDLQGVPAAVLGSNPVNALGMASAYGVFAANGVHHEPVAITRITDASGEVIYENRDRAREVLSPGAAYLTTQALQGAMQNGTGTGARIGRPAAGKTGTAQEYRDAWFAGYTPDLVAAVWVGYPEASIEMRPYCTTSGCRPTRIQVTGGSWPATIWQRFMSGALADSPPLQFEVPEGLVRVSVDPRTGCLLSRGGVQMLVPRDNMPEPCRYGFGSDSGSSSDDDAGPPRSSSDRDSRPGRGRGRGNRDDDD